MALCIRIDRRCQCQSIRNCKEFNLRTSAIPSGVRSFSSFHSAPLFPNPALSAPLLSSPRFIPFRPASAPLKAGCQARHENFF